MNHPINKDGDFLAQWLKNDGHKSLKPTDENFDMLNDVQTIIEHTDDFGLPQIDKDSLFDKINAEISDVKEVPKNRIWLYAAVAAIVLAMSYTVFDFLNNTKQIETPHYKTLKHKLPDNSGVLLNANAKLAYESDFKSERKLSLKGEAFFEVEKGSPFMVNTHLGTIEVLGTSFNVIAHEEVFKVSCKTGKVRVMINNTPYILTPGKEVSYFDKSVVEKSVSINAIDQWRNGSSYFEKSPLTMVVQSLKDWYGIELNLQTEHKFKEFTGSFVQDDLEKALKMVFLPMGLNYEINDNMVLIVE